MARDKSAAEDVNDLDQEDEEAVPGLLDLQQYGLDVVLEEDARDDALIDLGALLGHSVLVREQRPVVVRARGADAVDGRHDGHEVLELMEMR